MTPAPAAGDGQAAVRNIRNSGAQQQPLPEEPQPIFIGDRHDRRPKDLPKERRATRIGAVKRQEPDSSAEAAPAGASTGSGSGASAGTASAADHLVINDLTRRVCALETKCCQMGRTLELLTQEQATDTATEEAKATAKASDVDMDKSQE